MYVSLCTALHPTLHPTLHISLFLPPGGLKQVSLGTQLFSKVGVFGPYAPWVDELTWQYAPVADFTACCDDEFAGGKQFFVLAHAVLGYQVCLNEFMNECVCPIVDWPMLRHERCACLCVSAAPTGPLSLLWDRPIRGPRLERQLRLVYNCVRVRPATQGQKQTRQSLCVQQEPANVCVTWGQLVCVHRRGLGVPV